ncbi:hypothetical protein EVAR_103982_1 [Eumeta japonica]|uniref:Uncharacterized protein n=1 Tax=Eumeta variegata TaxID=151549 RepID=A0A4C1XZN2_EUMVA|nr:hypothetical protein EVAR_103982_1 [Eumeta japonica]
MRHGLLAANMRNHSPTQFTHDKNISDSKRNVYTARQRKRAVLLTKLEFEKLETERIAAQAATVRTEMLLLRLDADEEDTDDVNECENESHLSETDKLEKRVVILGGNEPAPKPSPTLAPPPLMAARSETNSTFLRNTDSSMSESTLDDAIIFLIMSASKETLRVTCEPSKSLADLFNSVEMSVNG